MSLCYDFSKWIIISLALVAISLTIGLVSIAHGQGINMSIQVNNMSIPTNGTNFSIDIPDNWTYERDLFDGYALAPVEFASLHIDHDTPLNEKMRDGGVYTNFVQKWDYPIKNAPLDTFVKYQIDKQDAINVTSKQNVTIDNEPAVKIYADGINSFNGIKFVEYMLMHNKEPYYLSYMANVKDFEKYLPEFEQIVKTFKFVK